jgi:hypothetical protein
LSLEALEDRTLLTVTPIGSNVTLIADVNANTACFCQPDSVDRQSFSQGATLNPLSASASASSAKGVAIASASGTVSTGWADAANWSFSFQGQYSTQNVFDGSVFVGGAAGSNFSVSSYTFTVDTPSKVSMSSAALQAYLIDPIGHTLPLVAGTAPYVLLSNKTYTVEVSEGLGVSGRLGSVSGQSGGTVSFGIIPESQDRLVVTTQPPANVVAGQAFEVKVSAEDANGNVDTNFTGNVTVALANNPGGSTVGGTLTVKAVNGVADFRDLTLDEPGSGYTLQATSSGLSPVTTNPFNVTDTLVVTTQPPSGVIAGSPFDVKVAAEDAHGNVDRTSAAA